MEFKCPYCLKQFSRLGNMKMHISWIHNKDGLHKCHICRHSFSSLQNYQMHLQKHDENVHKCPQCSKSFNRFSDLKRHIRIHTGDKPFICSYCNRSFNDLSNFRRHSKIHIRLKHILPQSDSFLKKDKISTEEELSVYSPYIKLLSEQTYTVDSTALATHPDVEYLSASSESTDIECLFSSSESTDIEVLPVSPEPADTESSSIASDPVGSKDLSVVPELVAESISAPSGNILDSNPLLQQLLERPISNRISKKLESIVYPHKIPINKNVLGINKSDSLLFNTKGNINQIQPISVSLTSGNNYTLPNTKGESKFYSILLPKCHEITSESLKCYDKETMTDKIEIQEISTQTDSSNEK